MDPHALLGLAAFALVTSITPGPNNMMLMASGANFGLRRTLPHLLGVAIGFVLLLLLVGAGVGEALDASPLLGAVLRWVCVLVLLRLAFMLARAGGSVQSDARGTPLTFLQAAAFQWVNPKGWAMALTAVGAYAPSTEPLMLLLVALVFGLVNLPSTTLWAVLGARIAGSIASSERARAIDVVLALLLLASGVPVLMA